MKWLLPILVSILIVLLYLTPQGTHLREMIFSYQNVEEESTTATESLTDDQGNDDDDDEEDEHPSRLHMKNDVLGIKLTRRMQQISGIEVHPAEAMKYRQEVHALAEVISIQPLLELRTRNEQLRAEIRITEVELQRSSEAFKRLSLLYEDNANISERQVEEARARKQADLARLAAQQQQLHSLRDKAIQLWGETLTQWALSSKNETLFQELLKRRDVLLNLALGREQTLPETSRIIFVNRNDERINARKAYLISPAPQTDPTLQGETYFFRTRADKFRVGMRIHAWIPVSGEVVDGVFAPNGTVVWQAGQPWIYLHDGTEFFYRRTLNHPSKLSGGWFIPAEEISEGELIVTRGAQMLLSEEYRWQIPDEDDNP